MNIEKKQLRDRNEAGFLANTIICITIIIISGLNCINEFNIGAVIRLAAAAACIVFNLISSRKLKSKEIYRKFCGYSLAVVYMITVFTALEPYMYAYAFPIAIMVMLFNNTRMTFIGAIVAIVVTIADSIQSVNAQMITVNQAVVQVIMVTMACILAWLIVKLQIVHNKQKTEELQEGVEFQTHIATSIVSLSDELNQRFEQAQEVSERLNETMESSHDAVSEIAESTHINAEAITQQTSQTSDIQQGIQEVGNESKKMEDISEKTNRIVAEGGELIEKLKKQALDVANINKETKETTHKLNESIKDVEAITETILGISSQTNLLALNASIEAARAGEAGKGFAVVAEEIRKLSEDTRKATEQISNIISNLTLDAENAAHSMTESAEYAEKQNELIGETGVKLEEIKEATSALHAGVVQVNDSVENIISANTLIMESITNLSATGQEVAASTDTALALSDSSVEALESMNQLLIEINDISKQMTEIADN